MKNILSRMSKKGLLIAGVVAVAIGISTAAQAWGPNRPIYTVANPADHVTFNSIVDNPDYGDERTFFDAKDAANTQKGGFVDNANVKDGQELLLRVYVHNNAASSLNGTNYNGVGVAKDSKVRIYLPTATANALRANAYVSASNANPLEVNDTVDFTAATPFSLSYVPGSAKMYTNAVPAGFALSDSIVAGGAPVGYTGPNGVIPGCFQYTGIVTVKVKVTMPKYSVEKKVRVNGTTDFAKEVTAKPGDKVDYSIAFKNTGSATLSNVVVGDELPKGVTYVKGTTQYISSATSNKWVTSSSDNVTVGGLNIGGFVGGGAGYVKFTAQLPAEKDLKCGVNEFVNTAYAMPKGFPVIKDTAIVRVTRECKPTPETPVYSCDLLQVTKGANRTVTAKVNYTATPADTVKLKMVTYNWGDSSAVTKTDKTTATHQYGADGTYKITAKLLFSVNGKDVDNVTSQSCTQMVTFTPPTTPPVTPPTTPETPEVLPNTGAGSVIGLFAAATIAGALLYRVVLSRKVTE